MGEIDRNRCSGSEKALPAKRHGATGAARRAADREGGHCSAIYAMTWSR